MSDNIKKQWVVKSNKQIDPETGNNLYWSDYGWANKEEAQICSDAEKNSLNISTMHPEEDEAVWEEG